MRDTNALDLEDRIRIQIESSRARLNEFFIDYDRLRSGYVSKTQFRRVLDQIMKISLKDDEIDLLARKYDTKNNSSVNYRLFCNVINKMFPENDVNNNPDANIFKNPEYLGTFRSMKKLDPSDEVNLQNILQKLNTYFSRRNIDILVNFRDFDKNNIGILTESQFKRCISVYSDVLSADDIDLIQKKYQQPERKGSTNYLNFYNDVYSKSGDNKNKESSSKALINHRPIQETGLSVQEIIDRISIICYKNGIRITDFFKDFDRLRSGVITERQFASGLIVGLEKAANITPEDIYQLAEYYRQPDGRVEYRSFCDNVENVFNIPDMEKKPQANVRRPPQGLLAKSLNGNLTMAEEDKVAECLEEISQRTRKYKMQLFPYFKDYDRSSAFTRCVTKLQFGRVLSTLNLMPDTESFALLCKKFEDAASGDVNYPAFCQAVDDEYVSAKIEDVTPEEELKKEPIEKNDFPIDTSNVDINEVIARIRSHTLSNRLRIKEFFQDMDPLNSGSVSKSQFIRCISSFGVSSLGGFNITRAQTEVLCNRFKNQNNEKINWKRFEEELESVFTVKNLERNPNLKVVSPEMFLMPPQGTAAWENENLESAQNYKTIIEDLKTVVQQRRLDCWPPFRDYDKLNRGHVTNKQFYQSLNKIGLKLSDTEVAILEAKFTNKSGFNYRQFLDYLQPIEVEKAKYNDLKQDLDRLNTIKPVYESNPLFDVQSILIKIKDQVYKRRVSIYEWLRDHDKLNSGRLLKETFKRAIDLCSLDLQPSEIELIVNYFSSQKDERMVEYKEFCVEIEKAFADNQLEKNPLLEVEQHAPKDPVELNVLLPDEVDKLDASLQKLAQRVRTQRIQLFPRFEDFDRLKNGYVTQNQFLRVLNDLSLGQMLNEIEMNAVLKKFSVRIGTRDDVNYVNFSDSVYNIGNFEYRLP